MHFFLADSKKSRTFAPAFENKEVFNLNANGLVVQFG